jgi:hypothetical protein
MKYLTLTIALLSTTSAFANSWTGLTGLPGTTSAAVSSSSSIGTNTTLNGTGISYSSASASSGISVLNGQVVNGYAITTGTGIAGASAMSIGPGSTFTSTWPR